MSTENLKIQVLEEKFNSGVKSLVQTTLEEFKLNLPGTAYFDPELNDLTSYYRQAEKSAYWVLTDADADGNQVFGGVGIYPINDKVCEVQKLYLNSALRGQGWGSKLLTQALEFAKKDCHYQFAYLDTRSELSAAVKLYQKFGFKELDAAPEHSLHNFMDHWFIKEL
jgi:putative acetyltransferase